MMLTIWRHGEAERGTDDRLRQLTVRGRDDISAGCSQLSAACSTRGIPQPQRILHSQWVRALQTAEAIGAIFSGCPVTAEPALHPGSDAAAVDAVLCLHDTQKHILLVSHQPLVSALVGHYLGTVGRVPCLTPGGLVTMSLEMAAPDCATLLFWAAPPNYETHA